MFISLGTDAFTIWLLPRLVGEAGFEPAMLLVTPGRLRNANQEKESHHASGKKYFGFKRRIRTGYILCFRQMLYRMS